MNENQLMSLFGEMLGGQSYKESWNKIGEAFRFSEFTKSFPEYQGAVRAQAIERDQVNSEGQAFRSRSICLFMGNGMGVKYLPLSPQSLLRDGDEVDIDTITIQPLGRTGDKPIFKADGLKKLM